MFMAIPPLDVNIIHPACIYRNDFTKIQDIRQIQSNQFSKKPYREISHDTAG